VLRGLGVLLLAFAVYQWNQPGGFHPLDQMLKFARRVGLMESVLDQAHRLAQPGLHLEHTNEPQFSWIGGLPSVAPGFEWPTWKGEPLAFLAQIDLAEVAAGMNQPWLPKQGQLYFFFHVSEEMVGGYDPEDAGAWQVVHTNIDRAALVPATMPGGLEEQALFPKTNIRFRRIATLPTEERFMGRWDLSNEEFEALLSARGAPFREQPRHQMFGYPYPEQDDGMELQAQLISNGVNSFDRRDPRVRELSPGADQWRLLLQMDTDDGSNMMWEDGGLLYFWIREQDAAKGDFSQVWVFLQSG
jgi:uncharacterized protein YwqG